MGHVVKSEDDSKYLCRLVFDIKDNGFNKEKVESIFERIIPRDNNDELLVRYNVTEKGNTTAIFIPKYEVINVSIKKLNEWLDNNTKDIADMYKVDDIELLRSYLFLMVLMHEVEHANQYLMACGKVEAPCLAIKDAYFTLFDLMKRKDYIIPRPIKQVRRAISLIAYKAKENEYLLERNAQFDSLSALSNIAFYNEHTDIRGVLLDMRNIFAVAGYVDNVDGALINTFRSICMGDKLKKFNHDYDDIDYMERYRLGLPVDKHTRERILALRR